MYFNAGAVWQIDDLNSVGIKVERGQWLSDMA